MSQLQSNKSQVPSGAILDPLFRDGESAGSGSPMGSGNLIDMATVDSLEGKTHFLLRDSNPPKRDEIGSENEVMEANFGKLTTKSNDEFLPLLASLKSASNQLKEALKPDFSAIKDNPIEKSPKYEPYEDVEMKEIDKEKEKFASLTDELLKMLAKKLEAENNTNLRLRSAYLTIVAALKTAADQMNDSTMEEIDEMGAKFGKLIITEEEDTTPEHETINIDKFFNPTNEITEPDDDYECRVRLEDGILRLKILEENLKNDKMDVYVTFIDSLKSAMGKMNAALKSNPAAGIENTGHRDKIKNLGKNIEFTDMGHPSAKADIKPSKPLSTEPTTTEGTIENTTYKIEGTKDDNTYENEGTKDKSYENEGTKDDKTYEIEGTMDNKTYE